MFTFKVTPDGAPPFEATATSRDVVQWEKRTKGKTFGALADRPAMGDLYGLAHVAAVRLGLFTGTFAEFETTVDLDFQEDESADPTPLAR